MTGIPSGRFFVVLPRLGMYTRRSGCGRRPRLSNRWMARHLASGVVQISPSTPGVRLPSFSDTRFTASTLAEYELTRYVLRYISGLVYSLAICADDPPKPKNWRKSHRSTIDMSQSK